MSASAAPYLHDLQFTPPADFAVSEVMVTLRGPNVDTLQDPRILQPQRAVRPNLIVHRRILSGAATLDLLCGEMCAELLSSIDQLQNLQTDAFTFADGADGRVIQFDFSAGRAASVRQYQVLRLDQLVFTTLTLTVSKNTLTDAVKDRYFAALASLGTPAKTTGDSL